MLHPRARTMLLLSLPAVAIGIASSLILIVVMKIASVLQNLLWQRLPGTLGIAQDSPLWIIGVLTLTGIAVGLVIRFSQGHAGPDPACEPLIGAPVPPSALPGLIVALILGLAGGVSLGPEHPIMTVNIALAVAIGARLLPRVNRMEWTILASAGTIGALFGTPVAAALIFSQTLNGSSEVPLWDRLFAPLMAAAAGALTTGLFSILIFTAHCSLRTDGNDRYSQRRNCRGDCHRRRDGCRMVLTTVARDDASNEKSGARAGYWRIYSRYSGGYWWTSFAV